MKHISSTNCDVVWKLICDYKERFGTRFDQVPICIGGGESFVLGSVVSSAANGCDAFRLMGQPDRCRCYGFDEQLIFVSPTGDPLTRIQYSLTLAGGEIVSGVTDDTGRTSRIRSARPVDITKAELTPVSMSYCTHGTCEGAPSVTRYLKDVRTNSTNLNKSTHQIVVQGTGRSLTRGEIALAWPIFRDSIDYGLVRVNDEPYLWFGLQPENTAITPDGNMYFNRKYFKIDFSQGADWEKHWFMHEMAHVWQHQLGFWVKWRGAIRAGLSYNYKLEQGKELRNYNMEAQASVIADYFAVKFLGDSSLITTPEYQNKFLTVLTPQYESVLSSFLADPRNENHLPSWI